MVSIRIVADFVVYSHFPIVAFFNIGFVNTAFRFGAAHHPNT